MKTDSQPLFQMFGMETLSATVFNSNQIVFKVSSQVMILLKCQIQPLTGMATVEMTLSREISAIKNFLVIVEMTNCMVWQEMIFSTVE